MSKTRNDYKRREQRKSSAEEHYEASHRDPLTQAMRLDDLLGAGKGAKKERARLKARLVAEKGAS